jgi:hypothetical protein
MVRSSSRMWSNVISNQYSYQKKFGRITKGEEKEDEYVNYFFILNNENKNDFTRTLIWTLYSSLRVFLTLLYQSSKSCAQILAYLCKYPTRTEEKSRAEFQFQILYFSIVQ